jgi:hypothetical protein
VTVRRLLGAALMVSVLLGGLVVVTAGPAVACSCAMVRSEAERVGRSDAVFVGTLVSQVERIDQKARELMRSSDPAVRLRVQQRLKSGRVDVPGEPGLQGSGWRTPGDRHLDGTAGLGRDLQQLPRAQVPGSGAVPGVRVQTVAWPVQPVPARSRPVHVGLLQWITAAGRR